MGVEQKMSGRERAKKKKRKKNTRNKEGWGLQGFGTYLIRDI